MPNRVVHFEIISPEAERIQRFFSDVFEWVIDSNNPMNYGMVDTGDEEGIRGGIAAPGPLGFNHVTFYVEVDDVDAALAKAVAAGGGVAMEKTPIGEPGQELILAQFTDPLGNRYGLSQRQARPVPARARPARKVAAKAKARPKAKAVKAKPAKKAAKPARKAAAKPAKRAARPARRAAKRR